MYDIITIAILALCYWRGAVKGILWQIASIAGLILCFFFAEAASLAVKPFIQVQPPLDRWIAIFGVYVIGSLAAFALARGIRSYLEKIKFDDYDKHLGGLFGVAKGVVICLIITFFAITLTPSSREAVMHSQSGYYAAVLMTKINPVMPDGLKNVIDPYIADFTPENVVKHREEHPQEGGTYLGGWLNLQGDDENHPVIDPETTPPETITNSLPELFNPELRSLVEKAFNNTSKEDREELFEKLKVGAPGVMKQIATEWLQGKPKETSELEQAPSKRYDNMLRQIAGVYGETLNAQEAVIDMIDTAFEGLPKPVVNGVLEDWHADMLPSQSIQDPDIATNSKTMLDTRIVRQLSKQGISVQTLASELQDRLQGAILQ